MNTIFWLSPSIESCSCIDFISVAYASWHHWNCGRTQRKAATINQLACPSYSLYVQLLWYPTYYPWGMKARVSPVQWSKPYSILAPTQDSNPGGRIQNHKRWPLHYHCTSVRIALPFTVAFGELCCEPTCWAVFRTTVTYTVKCFRSMLEEMPPQNIGFVTTLWVGYDIWK